MRQLFSVRQTRAILSQLEFEYQLLRYCSDNGYFLCQTYTPGKYIVWRA